jgi:hypothetical protein
VYGFFLLERVMESEVTQIILWSPAEGLWSVEVQYGDDDNLETDFTTKVAAALLVQHVVDQMI